MYQRVCTQKLPHHFILPFETIGFRRGDGDSDGKMSGTRVCDWHTGQVYTETSVPVRSMVPDWVSNSRGRRLNLDAYRHKGVGASSLLDMSFRCCARNGFDVDVLEFLDCFLAEKFYTFLKSRDILSFRDWLAFKRAFPKSEVIDRRWNLHIRSTGLQGEAPRELATLNKYLVTIPPTNLTYLELRGGNVAAAELMCLLHMPNLAVLVLVGNGCHDGGVHDHFVCICLGHHSWHSLSLSTLPSTQLTIPAGLDGDLEPGHNREKIVRKTQGSGVP